MWPTTNEITTDKLYRIRFHKKYFSCSHTKSILDINECATNNGGCDHHCEDIPGSFRCSCRSGYVLAPDGATCAGALLFTYYVYVFANTECVCQYNWLNAKKNQQHFISVNNNREGFLILTSIIDRKLQRALDWNLGYMIKLRKNCILN